MRRPHSLRSSTSRLLGVLTPSYAWPPWHHWRPWRPGPSRRGAPRAGPARSAVTARRPVPTPASGRHPAHGTVKFPGNYRSMAGNRHGRKRSRRRRRRRGTRAGPRRLVALSRTAVLNPSLDWPAYDLRMTYAWPAYGPRMSIQQLVCSEGELIDSRPAHDSPWGRLGETYARRGTRRAWRTCIFHGDRAAGHRRPEPDPEPRTDRDGPGRRPRPRGGAGGAGRTDQAPERAVAGGAQRQPAGVQGRRARRPGRRAHLLRSAVALPRVARARVAPRHHRAVDHRQAPEQPSGAGAGTRPGHHHERGETVAGQRGHRLTGGGRRPGARGVVRVELCGRVHAGRQRGLRHAGGAPGVEDPAPCGSV